MRDSTTFLSSTTSLSSPDFLCDVSIVFTQASRNLGIMLTAVKPTIVFPFMTACFTSLPWSLPNFGLSLLLMCETACQAISTCLFTRLSGNPFTLLRWTPLMLARSCKVRIFAFSYLDLVFSPMPRNTVTGLLIVAFSLDPRMKIAWGPVGVTGGFLPSFFILFGFDLRAGCISRAAARRAAASTREAARDRTALMGQSTNILLRFRSSWSTSQHSSIHEPISEPPITFSSKSNQDSNPQGRIFQSIEHMSSPLGVFSCLYFLFSEHHLRE
mmetsp:Transcript_28641/g.45658  ORF Transcript_28641/g.45658 Transcript_28641/m.45658 type:complete len:271 (-) Transcript_28641:3303-4115(-)